MNRIGVLTNAFRERRRIEQCILQFQKHRLLDHVVLCSRRGWNSNLWADEETFELAHECAGFAVEMEWDSEAEQFNDGMNIHSDKDWVIICDADERYHPGDIPALLAKLDSVPEEFNAVRTSVMPVYWKTEEYEITPVQQDYPLIAVRPTVKFTKARAISNEHAYFINIPMYHFSYVRDDQEMWEKISSFSHRDEFDINKWYKEVWLKWTPDSVNLHPVVPGQFRQAIYKPAPKEIIL